jgi:hypothetical protein
MTRRHVLWALIVLIAGAAAALLLPASPYYFPMLLAARPQYQGQPLSHWMGRLEGGSSDDRQQAIYAVGVIGVPAEDAVPVLARIMVDDAEPRLRNEAAFALSKMAPVCKTAVPELARALGDDVAFVRMNAARALYCLGSDGHGATPALLESLNDPDNQTNLGVFPFTVQHQMALALGRVSTGTDEAVPALRAALQAADTNEVRVTMIRALGEVGRPAQPAAADLRGFSEARDRELRFAVAEALAKIEGGPAPQDPAPREPPKAALPEDEQAYLWDIEHHGNVLVKEGLAVLAKAIQAGDEAALGRILAPDFRGADLKEPRRVAVAADTYQVERLEAAHASASLDRAAFTARLLQWRRTFGKTPPKAKFSIIELRPKTRRQVDGPWEGTALLRLHGEQHAGAPAETMVQLRYELARPTEKNLARPGWLRAAEVLEVVQGKSDRFLFQEVAAQRGLDTASLHDNWKNDFFNPTPGGVYVTDFDRDGILDMLVTDTLPYLYRGRSDQRFEDVTARMGLDKAPLTRSVVAWIDIDGDGWEDLIVGRRIYRNDQGRRFVDQTSACELRLPADAVNIAVADYDRDGKLDLYVTRAGIRAGVSWLDAHTGDEEGNHLYRNLGGWRFQNVTAASKTLGGHRSTFTAAWLDANDDGWPDLHVPNEFGDGVLLVNQRDGTFAEQALADRPADFGTMGLAVGDVNNDGRIDIYCANMFSKAGTRVIGNVAPGTFSPEEMAKIRRFVAGSQLHLNQGNLKFEQAGSKRQVAGIGWAYGAALADLNNDGWLDIYATAGFVSRDRNQPDG